MSEIDYKTHWEKVYQKTSFDQLGWYENEAKPSLDLIQACNVHKNAKIFNAGVGASTLIDDLLKLGYQNIIVNDISEPALQVLEKRLSNEDQSKVQFIADDLVNPTELRYLSDVEIWHDRAVLHFFIDEKDQTTYFELLKRVLKPGGFAIIAVFNLEGALKCSGLDVFRYNASMLQERLGNEFKLIKEFNYMYTTPSEHERSYIYTLFQNCKSV
jgi:SAM-dependent methyltransferase